MARTVNIEVPKEIFSHFFTIETLLQFAIPDDSSAEPSELDRVKMDAKHLFDENGIQILLNKLEEHGKLDDEELLITLQYRDKLSATALARLGKVEVSGQTYKAYGSVIALEQPNAAIIDVEKHTPEGGPITYIESPNGEVPKHLDTFSPGGDGIYISADSLDVGLPGELLVEVILLV